MNNDIILKIEKYVNELLKKENRNYNKLIYNLSGEKVKIKTKIKNKYNKPMQAEIIYMLFVALFYFSGIILGLFFHPYIGAIMAILMISIAPVAVDVISEIEVKTIKVSSKDRDRLKYLLDNKEKYILNKVKENCFPEEISQSYMSINKIKINKVKDLIIFDE